MQGDYAWFDLSITALERVLDNQITIIDNQGLFHTPAGQLIFPPTRQSHKKLAVCQCGFSQHCIDFCRHRMNALASGRTTAFTKTCWKGVMEIVVPLHCGDQHWGMFYLGAWRVPTFAIEVGRELPAAFAAHYHALPAWQDEHFTNLAPLLKAFTLGLVSRMVELNAVNQPPIDRARRIREYMHGHADSPHACIAELADTLNLSISRASRVVDEYFGCSFTNLLHQERINRAKVLLLSTDNSLAFIAAATGFSDEFYFSKIFRKLTGLPPGRFRRLGGIEYSMQD